jgi:hypothetical protein
MRVMQRPSIGQVLSPHGLHATSSRSTRWRSSWCAVWRGSVGPISTTVGVPSATAM